MKMIRVLGGLVFGDRLTNPVDAYKYMKGQPIKSPAGYDIKIDTPLDFAGVTDHSEYVGVVALANDVGIARTQFSSAFAPFLRQRLDLALDHEDALEAYYNLALTDWLTATADLQIIDSGLQKTLNASGLGLVNVDTVTVLALRPTRSKGLIE